MSTIQIIERNVNIGGEKAVIQILMINGSETLLVSQVAEMVNVTPQNIRQLTQEHGLECATVGCEHLKELKELGVLPLRTATANLLPKATVQALVKIVNTSQAWAIYNQLWKDSEQLHAAPAADASTMTLVSNVLKNLATGITALDHDLTTTAARLDHRIDDSLVQQKAELAKQPLTAEQLRYVEDLIKTVGRRENMEMPRGNGFLKQAIKKWYFGADATPRKWVQIPQSAFADLCAFLEAYQAPVYTKARNKSRLWAKRRTVKAI